MATLTGKRLLGLWHWLRFEAGVLASPLHRVLSGVLLCVTLLLCALSLATSNGFALWGAAAGLIVTVLDFGYSFFAGHGRRELVPHVPEQTLNYAKRHGHRLAVFIDDAILDRLQQRQTPHTHCDWSTNRGAEIEDHLRNWPYSRSLLRAMRRSTPKDGFLIDEPKPSMASDYQAIDQQHVKMWTGSYFRSIILQAPASHHHKSTTRYPDVKQSDKFVAENVFPNGELLPLDRGDFASHIGVNTIAFTRDGFFKLWHQRHTNRYSANRIAPTGSGSMDPEDVLPYASLEKAAVRAMERELQEESTANNILRSRLIGYFRDLERAGHPGFLGLTVVDQDSAELQPDGREVEHRPRDPLVCKAWDLSSLKNSVEEVLQHDNLSLPVYANLYALQRMANEQPEVLREFLWGR